MKRRVREKTRREIGGNAIAKNERLNSVKTTTFLVFWYFVILLYSE